MAIVDQSSRDFYIALNASAGRQRFPLRVMFELTHRCNFRCLHCYLPRKRKKELTTSQVFLVLDQLRDLGTLHVGFTGGEPFLRKDFFKIIEYAKNCGFRISIFSNGYLINRQAAGKLASLGASLNRVDISILGSTAKTFEAITRKKGSYSQAVRAIRLLKDKNVAVQIKTTLLSLNAGEILEIKRFAREKNCLFRCSPLLSRKTDGGRAPLKYLPEPEALCRVKSSLACGRQRKVGKGRKDLFHCGAGRSEITISPEARMNLCLQLAYPQLDILGSSLSACWKKIQDYLNRLQIPAHYQCASCSVASFCRWCPARSWLFKKDLFSCDPELKKFALLEAGCAR